MTTDPTVPRGARRPPDPAPPRVWTVLVGVVAMLVLALFALTELADRSGGRGTALPPAPATAPPDPGADVPTVRIGGADPQDQLAGWAAPLADRLGVPQPALEAYGYAAAATAERDPECGLSWTVVAGIGAVESDHGRFGGATLDEQGRSTPPVRGLSLDGRPGIREIPDTDGGRLDGDTGYDRAVGPMQFIPATWARHGVDGDGDGLADPDDLDDAALAAAGYLCASGRDLASADGWWRAVLTYNRSASYGQDVLDRADGYGRASRGA